MFTGIDKKTGERTLCRAKDPEKCPYHSDGSHKEMSQREVDAFNEGVAAERARATGLHNSLSKTAVDADASRDPAMRSAERIRSEMAERLLAMARKTSAENVTGDVFDRDWMDSHRYAVTADMYDEDYVKADGENSKPEWLAHRLSSDNYKSFSKTHEDEIREADGLDDVADQYHEWLVDRYFTLAANRAAKAALDEGLDHPQPKNTVSAIMESREKAVKDMPAMAERALTAQKTRDDNAKSLNDWTMTPESKEIIYKTMDDWNEDAGSTTGLFMEKIERITLGEQDGDGVENPTLAYDVTMDGEMNPSHAEAAGGDVASQLMLNGVPESIAKYAHSNGLSGFAPSWSAKPRITSTVHDGHTVLHIKFTTDYYDDDNLD